MRELPILEFKSIVDDLQRQRPMARVDFVFPKRHGGKVRSALGNMTDYSILLDSSNSEQAIVRFYINYAHQEPEDEASRYASLEPAILALVRGDISPGRMRECFDRWRRGDSYELPLTPQTPD